MAGDIATFQLIESSNSVIAGFHLISPDSGDINFIGPPGPPGEPGPPGSGSIASTTNLIKGDGAGAGLDSGIDPADVVQKQTAFPTPTNSSDVVACLQAAGLCACIMFFFSLICPATAFATNFGDIPFSTDVSTLWQPPDADLTALAALSGTHTIYYRSAANTWSSVTIGSGLDFTGATLSATGGGTVTSFSAGNLSPLFTTSVATSTTTPALSFSLSNASSHTFFANNTGSTGAPSFTSFVSGTDYAPATSGGAILYANGAGGFSDVTIGPNLTFIGGTLAASGGGATAFTGLTDVPSSYTGQSLKSVRVNSGETALEFYTPSGGGTVTHTGGALTSNSVVLGAGTDDVKVVTGIVTDGTAKLTLGVNTTTLGQLKLFGSTSGDATIQPAAVAGTSTVVTLPNASSTLPIFGQQITFAGPTAARTVTFPDAAFTAARTDAANTFTGHQTIEGVTSTGATGTGKFVFDTAPQISTIELGAASDTTIARVGAGQISVEGVNLVTTSSTDALTNKRITPRASGGCDETSSATSTPTADSCDQWDVTALAAADAFAAPSGTPLNGQKLIVRIKDNGTARALTWNAIYRASSDLALPSTTVLSKTLYLGFIYNAADSKWDLLAVLNNF